KYFPTEARMNKDQLKELLDGLTTSFAQTQEKGYQKKLKEELGNLSQKIEQIALNYATLNEQHTKESRGRTIEVPISHTGTESLKEPQKDDWEKGSGDTFDEFTYEDEELDEIDGYYTVESSDDEIDLYSNPWKDEVSPTIYLTIVKEVPIQKNKEETKPTLKEQLEKFVQTDTLNSREKEEARTFFKKEGCLLTISLDKLGTTSLVTHHIDTGDAKPIKQHFYRTSPDEQEFLDEELESLERQGLGAVLHRAGKMHNDTDALSRQHDPQEVGSNRVEADVSTQKCRKWLLSLAECDAEECYRRRRLTAHNDYDEWDDSECIDNETEAWWDLNEEFETYLMVEEAPDKEEKDIKLEEYVDSRGNPSERAASVNGHELGSHGATPMEFQKLTMGIDLGYTEPLDEGAINADREIQLRRNDRPIIVKPLKLNSEPSRLN
ncbi:22427_t:CDS:2, partial [Cetraspora pellucida]